MSTDQDLKLAKEKLAESGCTCAAVRGDTVITSEKRGIEPILLWISEGTDLDGATVADRVVGKAPALLYTLTGVRHVFAYTMTKDAMRIFERAGISYSYDQEADKIINRMGTDICPMEKAASSLEDPEEALHVLWEKRFGTPYSFMGGTEK